MSTLSGFPITELVRCEELGTAPAWLDRAARRGRPGRRGLDIATLG